MRYSYRVGKNSWVHYGDNDLPGCTTIVLAALVVIFFLISIPVAFFTLFSDGLGALNSNADIKDFAKSVVQPIANVTFASMAIAIISGSGVLFALNHTQRLLTKVLLLVLAIVCSASVAAQVVILNILPFDMGATAWNASPMYVIGGLLVLVNWLGVIAAAIVIIAVWARPRMKSVAILLAALFTVLLIASHVFAIDPPANYAWSLAGAAGWVLLGCVTLMRLIPARTRLR